MDQSKIDAARAKIALGQTTLAEGVAELLAATAPAVEPPKEEPKPEQPKPDAPVRTPTIKAASLADVLNAVKAAEAGAVIQLAKGAYSALTIKGLAVRGVRLVGEGVTLAGLRVLSSSGLIFEGFSADLTEGGLVQIDGSSQIVLAGLTSRNAKYYGVSILRSQGVQVIEADIADAKDGVQSANSRGVLVERCKIRRFRSDGINMCGVSDLKVIGNDVAESAASPGAHPDGLQLHTASADAPAENIEVIGNSFRRGAGQKFQGVFITDQTDGAKRYRNVVIRENLIEGGMWNGVMVANADNVELTGNTVQPYTDMDSWIRIASCSGVRMERNAYTKLVLEGANPGLVQRDKATLSAIAAR